MTARHRTLSVAPPPELWWLGSDPVEVDASLAPLVGLLWQAGISTTSCCEHDPHTGSAVIGFRNIRDAETMLNCIFPPPHLAGDDPLIPRLRNWDAGEPVPSPDREGWRVFTAAEPAGDRWGMAAQWYFPLGDAEEVARRLREHTQTRRRGNTAR